MVKKKNHKLSKINYILLALGFISITLIAIFIANSFFRERVELLFIEAIVYVAVVVMYVQAFRASSVTLLVQFARVVSYAGIIMAILIASFIAYFVTTFRW